MKALRTILLRIKHLLTPPAYKERRLNHLRALAHMWHDAHSLLDAAEKDGVKIKFSASFIGTRKRGAYSANKVVYLNPQASNQSLFGVLVHELFHHYQTKNVQAQFNEHGNSLPTIQHKFKRARDAIIFMRAVEIPAHCYTVLSALVYPVIQAVCGHKNTGHALTMRQTEAISPDTYKDIRAKVRYYLQMPEGQSIIENSITRAQDVLFKEDLLEFYDRDSFLRHARDSAIDYQSQQKTNDTAALAPYIRALFNTHADATWATKLPANDRDLLLSFTQSIPATLRRDMKATARICANQNMTEPQRIKAIKNIRCKYK